LAIPLLPLFVFSSHCAKNNVEVLSFGVTSQDLQDTVHVLRLKKAHKVIYNSLRKLNRMHSILLNDTLVRSWRTHAVHAGPITFGYKMAVWVRD
jgi:adenylosuccinate lyase